MTKFTGEINRQAIAIEALTSQRSVFLKGFGSRELVRYKGLADPFTEVDIAVENGVVNFLRNSGSPFSIVAEESSIGTEPLNDTWVLDPIDGTVNFALGNPLCGISLALLQNGQPVDCAIYLPCFDQKFSASSGRGAYLEGTRISVAKPRPLARCVIAFGDISLLTRDPVSRCVAEHTLARLLASCERVRMLGSAAVDFAWTASGKIDGLIMFVNQPWDSVAGALLIQEAGGCVVDGDGKNYHPTSLSVIAGNAAVVEELVKLVQFEKNSVLHGD